MRVWSNGCDGLDTLEGRYGRMKVLVIGINYAPEQTGIGPYTEGLARFLVNRGDSVKVITGLPSYPEWRVHTNFGGVLRRKSVEHGVTVIRHWHIIPSSGGTLGRIFYELSFLWSLLPGLFSGRPDAIIGIVPSLSGGLLSLLLATRFKVPYGLLFQDLVGLAVNQSGMSSSASAGRLARSLEWAIARRASAVAVVADGFRPYFEGGGVPSSKIQRIRNWSRAVASTGDGERGRRHLGLPANRMICLHTGNMGHKQGLDVIVDTAALARRSGREDLLFVLVGDGNQRHRLENLARRERLENLLFLPLQSTEHYADTLAAADVLLLTQRGDVRDMSLPSKLTSYFRAGRPVIAAVAPESETFREMCSGELGLLVEPGDPSAILAGILKLKDDAALRDRLVVSAHTFLESALSEGHASKRVLGFVDSVAAGACPRLLARGSD